MRRATLNVRKAWVDIVFLLDNGREDGAIAAATHLVDAALRAGKPLGEVAVPALSRLWPVLEKRGFPVDEALAVLQPVQRRRARAQRRS